MTAVSLRSRVRVVLQHLALVVLGFAVALVVAEGLLQAAAWYVRATGRSPQAIRLTGSERVVCVGDSNTYGLYLQRDQGYPAELQKQWNAHPDLPPIEVVNLGVPGTNSSKLRASFARILETFSPNVVLIMIGANDVWTLPVPVDATPESAVQRLLRASRGT